MALCDLISPQAPCLSIGGSSAFGGVSVASASDKEQYFSRRECRRRNSWFSSLVELMGLTVQCACCCVFGGGKANGKTFTRGRL